MGGYKVSHQEFCKDQSSATKDGPNLRTPTQQDLHSSLFLPGNWHPSVHSMFLWTAMICKSVLGKICIACV